MMRKNLGFCAIAVLALGLGIGANNTVFTLVNTILFKSLPFLAGHEIVSLGCNNLPEGMDRLFVSYPDLAVLKCQEAVVGNGDAVCIAAEVGKDLSGSSEGRFCNRYHYAKNHISEPGLGVEFRPVGAYAP
jgi:hypothetical protein